MRVEIHSDGQLIGRSTLNAADPSMGAATGVFEPSPAYRPDDHAGEIEGTHNPTGSAAALEAWTSDHGIIECQSIFIQDYSHGLNERRVSVLGIPHPQYETIFDNDPMFKAERDKP